MATAQGGYDERRGPRPAARLALGLALVLLVIALCGGLVAPTLAAAHPPRPVAPGGQAGPPGCQAAAPRRAVSSASIAARASASHAPRSAGSAVTSA